MPSSSRETHNVDRSCDQATGPQALSYFVILCVWCGSLGARRRRKYASPIPLPFPSSPRDGSNLDARTKRPHTHKMPRTTPTDGPNSNGRTKVHTLPIRNVHLRMRHSMCKSGVAQNVEIRVLLEDDCFLPVSDLWHLSR